MAVGSSYLLLQCYEKWHATQIYSIIQNIYLLKMSFYNIIKPTIAEHSWNLFAISFLNNFLVFLFMKNDDTVLSTWEEIWWNMVKSIITFLWQKWLNTKHFHVIYARRCICTVHSIYVYATHIISNIKQPSSS